ncbi:hypothetical protein [Micromonospora costi]|uniref:hypothetical protein n=1 Tax=Micromonospora costi TaxID=1530042 RepID=UPI0011C491E5|nr:hypothetical protein [Micromonospora costi]
MNVPEYLLGLATLPAALGAGWLLWRLARLVNRVGDDLLRRLPVGRRRSGPGSRLSPHAPAAATSSRSAGWPSR